MEKFSSFERVVGKIPETEKESILHQKDERFSDQFFGELEGREREKTQEELIILSLINDTTNELRQAYGLPRFDIPAQNIHVIRQDEWPKNKGTAFYNSMLQAIALKEQPARLVFMKKALHEMIHFKSYGSMQITTNEEPQEYEYRSGLTITKRDGSQIFFRNINEAVVEELTKSLFLELSGQSIFSDEVDKTSEITEKGKNMLSVKGEPLFNSDTYYAEIEDVGNDKVRVNTEGFTYPQERRILKKLIRKLFERNPGYFEDEQEVFELFASSMITGKILALGKLIDSTFPKGTFRKIGALDGKIDEQEVLVDSL